MQYLANQFWIRWRQNTSHSFTRDRSETSLNETVEKEIYIVLLLDDGLSRNQWPLAQMTKVFSSRDGFVRKVQLSVVQDGKRKQLERLIHKLVLLLAQEDTTDQDVIPVRGASTKNNN